MHDGSISSKLAVLATPQRSRRRCYPQHHQGRSTSITSPTCCKRSKRQAAEEVPVLQGSLLIPQTCSWKWRGAAAGAEVANGNIIIIQSHHQFDNSFIILLNVQSDVRLKMQRIPLPQFRHYTVLRLGEAASGAQQKGPSSMSKPSCHLCRNFSIFFLCDVH